MISNIWVVLAALALSNVVEQIDRYVFQVSPIPIISYDSYEYSLLAGTLFSIVYCVGVIFFALLNERVQMDRISIVALSCCVSSVALILIPFVTQFWHLALLRLLMGFAQSPITTFCAAYIKDKFVEDKRGIAFGIFNSGVFMGFALSLVFGTVLYDSSGWQRAYFFFGSLGIVYSVAIRLGITEASEDASSLGSKETNHSANANAASAGAHSAYEPLLMDAHDSSVSTDSSVPTDDYSKRRESDTSSLCEYFLRKLTDVWAYTSLYSSIYWMCLACGLRFAAGYQYSNYIGIFFSDKYEVQEDHGVIQTCSYSYDSAFYDTTACNEEYPYCIDQQCNRLTPFPWRNEGMAHEQFETAFAVSTVIGSISGSLLGGYLGDWVSKNTSYGVPGRLIIAGAGLLISAPMYIMMYNTEYPTCFVFLALGGVFGEMYYGLSVAVLAEMVPEGLFTVACSLFISVLIAFGSNATMLVPAFTRWLESGDTVKFQIVAASTEGNANNEDNIGMQTFIASAHGDSGLKKALSWLIGSLYVISGLLFLVTVRMVRRDLDKIRNLQRIDSNTSSVGNENNLEDEHGVENVMSGNCERRR